jgi:putative oxidoreductase
MNILQSSIGFLGRAFLSVIFISSAVQKLFDWQATAQYFIQSMTDALALNIGFDMLQHLLEWGMANATTLLIVATIFELVGGLMVFLGLWVRFGAFLLFLFMIPTTLVFHHFWQLQGPDRMLQMIMFMKNVSIIGGLLILMAYYGRGCKSAHQQDHSIKNQQ